MIEDVDFNGVDQVRAWLTSDHHNETLRGESPADAAQHALEAHIEITERVKTQREEIT